MRLLHTADWHLGHTLHGVARDYEHRRFLDWLLDTLEEQAADALCVCGDIFDSANPPASAQALFYDFIAAARRRCPELDIVVVGGNHDSPARLEAPAPLLERLGARVVGNLPRGADGAPDFRRLLVPLRGPGGEIAAWCVAMPFLRPQDLAQPAADAAGDPLIDGVRGLYAQALAAARALRQPGQALIATGHCYMVGGSLCELSERRVLGGNQHALPADIFPEDLAYAALGHLHRPQRVGGRDTLRYSGAPLPLSLGEADYPHQVLRVDFKDGACVDLAELRVPRAVEILRLPGGSPRPLPEVLAQLRNLELSRPPRPEAQPFLEISVRLDAPDPGLRHQVETALDGKPVRLLHIAAHYPGQAESLADSLPRTRLPELQPEEVFLRRYRDQYRADPSTALLEAFRELHEALHP